LITNYYILFLSIYFVTDASYRFKKKVVGFRAIFVTIGTCIVIAYGLFPLWLNFLLMTTIYVNFGLSILVILFFIWPTFILSKTIVGLYKEKLSIILAKTVFYGSMFACVLMIFGTYNILNDNKVSEVFKLDMTFTETIIETIRYGFITARQGITDYPKTENIVKLIQGTIVTIGCFILSDTTLITFKFKEKDENK